MCHHDEDSTDWTIPDWKCWFLQVQTNPRLSSCSGSNWSVVVADRTVILFDQSYQVILLLLDFGMYIYLMHPSCISQWM